MELRIDLERWGHKKEMDGTSLFVRAKLDSHWKTTDILFLDKESLLFWIKSRGGDNPWAEDVVGILLGHGHLHPLEENKNGAT